MTAPNFQESQDSQTSEDFQQEGSEVTTEQAETTESPSSDSAASSNNEEFSVLSTFAQNAARQNQILQQQLLEMKQQLEGINNRTQQNAPKAPVVTDDDFRESPAAAMERLFDHKLEEKLNRTVAPLLESHREQQRERVFNTSFVSTLQAMNPALLPYAENLAPEVKSFLGSADPTPQNIQMATLMAVGKYAMSGGSQQAPQSSAPSNTSSNMSRQPVPASAPSSAPRTKPNTPKLTESQLRAFNRLGYKAGQEQDFLNMLAADEVRF